MSWEVVLLSSKQKVNSLEEADESQLLPTDFCSVFENHFKQMVRNEEHRDIKGPDYSIDYYIDEEKVSSKLMSLDGENALYELIVLAKKHNWQIFDAGLGQMIDLENPSNNGYKNFQNYLARF